ncbi:MAG: RES family NAD+ phosphorylase [Candidatus Hydrogenedentes bacterium]|nr:RES family NAD+ phosphorylase [Candidatus Hydrogenedentota bacterium]
MNPHPKYTEILQGILRILKHGVTPWSGVVYRYASSKYSSDVKILSGIGAYRAGGRWNPPNTFHAVYCASSPGLAHAEYLSTYRIAGIPLSRSHPVTGKALEVNGATALDLRDTGILSQLSLSLRQLKEDRWKVAIDEGRESLCQAVGRAAFTSGVEILLTPSILKPHSEDFNVVLIIENAQTPSEKCRVLS